MSCLRRLISSLLVASAVKFDLLDDGEIVRLAREFLTGTVRLGRLGGVARPLVAFAHTYHPRTHELVLNLQATSKRTLPSPSDVIAAYVLPGLATDALRFAGTAIILVGGDRFWRTLRASAVICMRVLAVFVASAIYLQHAASVHRHA